MDAHATTATANIPRRTRPDTSGHGLRRRVLSPTSRRQQVVDLLRGEIIAGELAPGLQLKQDALCAEFASSPTPVREALRQLESEGLVVHRPNHGVFVAEITAEDLLGVLLPVRLAIESHAVPRAAARLRAEGAGEGGGFGELEAIVTAMGDAAAKGNPALISELHVRFHDLTVQTSGSAQALQLWRSVQPRIRTLVYGLAPQHTELAEIVLDHIRLLAAMRADDPAVLHDLLTQHIIGSVRQLLGPSLGA